MVGIPGKQNNWQKIKVFLKKKIFKLGMRGPQGVSGEKGERGATVRL